MYIIIIDINLHSPPNINLYFKSNMLIVTVFLNPLQKWSLQSLVCFQQRSYLSTEEAKSILYDKETWVQYKNVLMQRLIDSLPR